MPISNKFFLIQIINHPIPGKSGINVQTSSIHFLLDSVSILPHCRSNHRTVTSSVASVHDLKDNQIKIYFLRNTKKNLRWTMSFRCFFKK
jgi:hypothetical protein